MDDRYKAFNELTAVEITKQIVARGGYEVVIDDLPTRVDIFIDQVVREQVLRSHKGHVKYVATLASYLTWVLMTRQRGDLVGVLIDKILSENVIHPEVDLDLVAREAAMEEQYIIRMLEKGYAPISPFERAMRFGNKQAGKIRKDEIIRLDRVLEDDGHKGF